MNAEQLGRFYRGYIACLNARDWAQLGQYVHGDASHNGRRFGLAGYQAMLEQDFAEIPDLHFEIALAVFDPPNIAARLAFDCSPIGMFLGLAVNGKRVRFAEHVFYEIRGEKIWKVWSLIDKAAIAAQL